MVTDRSADWETAKAFSTSWNNLPRESVYTLEQFEDWMFPLGRNDFLGKEVLELGCGNASLMIHALSWEPTHIWGVELGASTISAERNLEVSGYKNWSIVQDDLVTYRSPGSDLVYSVGVLHHLADPHKGFQAVIQNTKRGGQFHCWVYAEEGNKFVIRFVDPMRKIVSRLPWWITKYLIATPLAGILYVIVKCLVTRWSGILRTKLPLIDYCLWLSRQKYKFVRHVVFDQLVAPRTSYISERIIRNWLNESKDIDQKSAYIIFRNGNSWKFGGKVS